MKVLCGIVLFHPDVVRVTKNIESLRKDCDFLLVDNSEKTDEKILALESEKVHLLSNNANTGMSHACNEIFGYAVDHGYDWVLTLDQDSIVHGELIQKYLPYTGLPKAGILTCRFMDLNTGNVKREKPMEEYAGYSVVNKCIASGAFCSVSAYQISDGFDEQMFIDEVDRDYCWNLLCHGYKVYEIAYTGIDHELGHSEVHHLGKKSFVIYNESVFRHYYIARNQMYIHRKYQYRDEGYMRKNELHGRIKILLFENDKKKKLEARRKGLADYKKMKIEKQYDINPYLDPKDTDF
jgi:rhamnosyltransferase